MKCQHCDALTNNPKFCSRACSASQTNRIPKRQKTKHACATCKVEIYKGRTYCRECWSKQRITATSELTLQEYVNRPSVCGKHPSWHYAHIREFARRWNRAITKSCQICGYSKHVEVAHIKAISSFPLTAKLKDINAASNVLGLCPNCHWEYDHGQLVAPAGLEPALIQLLVSALEER